jgi:replicative DNA helicase
MSELNDGRRRKNGGRVPPHNLDAEASLLGALLLSKDALTAVAETGITASDFYKPAHQHIYEAIRVLASVGEPVDAVTVAEELRRNGLLDELGGPTILLELQAATPAISNATRYARIVQDTAMLRRLISVASDIAELAYDEPDDVTKVLDEAETKVFEVAEHRVSDRTVAIGDLLPLALNDLEARYEHGIAVTGTPTGFTDLDELLTGLQPSTLNVVGARPSMGKCIAWDTPVLDPATGDLVTAAELHRRGTAGDWVQVVALERTGRLEVATPSAFVDDGVKPVYEVTTRLGRVVRTTASHPFLTDGGWRPLAELTVGTNIAVAARLPYFGHHPLPAGELLLLAHYLGDGGLRGTEEQRRDEAVQRCRSMDVDGLALMRRHDLFHADDRTVALPPAVTRLPRDQLLRFLERLIEANRLARTDRRPAIVFQARSAPLVRGVQHLLLRFGVVTSRHTVREQHRGGERTVHALVVESATAHAVDVDAAARLGVPTPALVAAGRTVPRAALAGSNVAATDVPREERRPDVCWDEIVAITPRGEDQVYDLTVPGLANFVAADVVVHNTAFALGVATHVAVERALPVLFFSLEMGHAELTLRILSAEARVDSQKMRTGRLSEQDWSKIGRAIGRLEAPLFIDDNPNVTVMEIRAKARRLAQRYGHLGVIVVDYLQLMTGRTTAENRQVEVSEISRGLKILARELTVPIIALSQLSRNLESRADKRPMLSDLRESGSIEQDSDVVMFIYRDEVYNPDSSDRGVAEIIVAKQRNGPIGTKRLVYLAPYTRFDNAARGL